MLSQSEENYLKVIWSLGYDSEKGVTTNAIAERLSTRAPSVTDMLKRLSDKKLVNYRPYQGVKLTVEGEKLALRIVRKHRLWETFLVEKLNFRWDEVHELAEQLEHVTSPDLTDRLDKFLDNPKFDPHGDPIPDRNGKILDERKIQSLDKMKKGGKGVIAGVNDTSTGFLQYLDKMGLNLGEELAVEDILSYDGSVLIRLNNNRSVTISGKAAGNIYIKV